MEDGIAKISEGVTTVEEVVRVTRGNDPTLGAPPARAPLRELAEDLEESPAAL